MKIVFKTRTDRIPFEVSDKADVGAVVKQIGKERLRGKCVYIQGKLIDTYENIVKNKELMSTPINAFCNVICYISAMPNGWLTPNSTPWKPGHFGKCPYCGKLNNGMQLTPTKFCPHCGQAVC